MQSETVATEPVPTPVVEAAAAPVVETPAPLAGGDAAAAPVAAAPVADAPVAAALAGGEAAPAAVPAEPAAALQGGGKHRHASRSKAHGGRRKCPSGTLRRSKKNYTTGQRYKVCSKTAWLRVHDKRMRGGDALEGGRSRRRRSRSRSRRH